MTMPILMILIIIVNIFTIYRLLFKLVFRDSDDFNESIKYSMTPDIISFFRGEYVKDSLAELKLAFFAISCILVTVVEYSIINYLINLLMGN